MVFFVGSSLFQVNHAKRKGAMQMILLLSVVCAASGFTLEMPELPDLIGTVGKVFGGNFTLKMVEEPKVFLPKVSQIESMTREESMERFHWFFCVYILIFLVVTLLGSVIMVVGPILKSKCLASSSDSAESSELLSSEACDLSVSSYEALGPSFTALSAQTQQCLVILSFGVTVSLSLVASLWSLKTGRLSKVTGLDWEVYLILFCCVGLALLCQAVWAVARLKPSDRFDSTAFAVAAFTSMAPIISDFYDTLKDVIFGALCLQSEHLMIQILGLVSWLYLCLFHAWFLVLFFRRFQDRETLCGWACITFLLFPLSLLCPACFLVFGGEIFNGNLNFIEYEIWLCACISWCCLIGFCGNFAREFGGEILGRHCFAELASSHLSVLLTSPKVPGEWAGGCTATGCWEGTILPILYKQLTPSKREHLLIENAPQAVFSVIFLLVEGGSFFVGVLNLLVPGVQILLTFFCFEPVLSAAAPALGKKLNRAMRNGDTVAAAFLWEEAELGHSDNLQLFGLILPRLTFFLDTLSRHGFNKDPTKLNEEELAMVQRVGAAYLGQAESYRCRNLGEVGTKVVAEAMTTNCVTHSLDLNFNNMGDAGAQALAESLKINCSLKYLDLGHNNIGAAGAQAVAEALKINSSLGTLWLQDNNMGDAGAQALAESLKINRSLRILRLRYNKIGAAGAEALAESLKINVTLEYLYLEQNNIGPAGALALAAGLLQNRGLRRLYLRLGSGGAGDEGRRALEDAEKTKRGRGEDFWIYGSN